MTLHTRDLLTPAKWAAIAPHFPKHTRPGTGRLFLEAVMFRSRTGIPWRDLPERFGRWERVYRRFSRWNQRGFFQEILEAVRREVGVELAEARLDSSAVKLHASAHGSKKRPFSQHR